MDRITSETAAQMLGIPVSSVYVGASRGVLTYAGRAGRGKLLAREQVELFIGKSLSLAALSSSERTRWEALALEAAEAAGHDWQRSGTAPLPPSIMNPEQAEQEGWEWARRFMAGAEKFFLNQGLSPEVLARRPFANSIQKRS